MTPASLFQKMKSSIKAEWKAAFLAAVIIGLLVHMPIMLSDIPNHDGLDSIYFDQNMITSGRWFLMIACGFSSFYALPWVIGVLGLIFLGIAAAAVTEILEVRKIWAAAAIGGLFVSFPSMASTFAYVFTLDGYMLGLLLAVLSVLFTCKYKWGFLPGAVCLAFSLGTYQAYLPFAMILSIFCVWKIAAKETPVKERILEILHYLYMGVGGTALYYLLLQILLKIQGKELASYQGINEMTAGSAADAGLLQSIYRMYRDFFAFTIKGKVLFHNSISAAAVLVLFAAVLVTFAATMLRRKWWKNALFLSIMVLTLAVLPLAANVILLISPSVTYHLLMRYQWVLFFLGAVAFLSNREEGKGSLCGQYVALAAAAVLILFYGVTDNIGYSNLQKKYEKTYAYCLRLLDRIEQTEGYYPGIPVTMIGVVGNEQFPTTDVTADVTANMIGLGGDYLLYTGPNYELFLKNYLGATLNFLPADSMAEMYYDERYVEMESFPGANSIKIIDGVMYIKTENVNR
ncbi:MAG: glucosyltransferase domain-containing protein [Acetatifactor sp.]|nr:glucosyltransferase domain-containing protein [Acetatifactor sp.]